MVDSRRRGPGRRLVLTLAALASLILGYYLGQYWQRQPLAELSAVVYPSGKRIDYPVELNLAANTDDDTVWRLFVAADTREPACVEMRRNFALVINRLAHRPKIQQRLRLSVLAYDRPDMRTAKASAWDDAHVDVIGGDSSTLDTLSGQLGILPSGEWCRTTQDNAILVAPDATAWALIPQERPAIMAHNIATIIEFVE